MGTLVIADSRGKGLQQLVDKNEFGIQMTVVAHAGAGFELAAIKSLQIITRAKPENIILALGICDITRREQRTKHTTLRYSKIDEAVQHVMGAIKSAYELIFTTHECKISIATITGIDLADYNYSPRRLMTAVQYEDYCNNTKIKDDRQDLLNLIVIEVNRQITALNKRHGIPTTWLSTAIHSYYRNTHHHKYGKLADGCHLSGEIMSKWAVQLIKSARRILHGQ